MGKASDKHSTPKANGSYHTTVDTLQLTVCLISDQHFEMRLYFNMRLKLRDGVPHE